jgi:phage anti-repressor protein
MTNEQKDEIIVLTAFIQKMDNLKCEIKDSYDHNDRTHEYNLMLGHSSHGVPDTLVAVMQRSEKFKELQNKLEEFKNAFKDEAKKQITLLLTKV